MNTRQQILAKVSLFEYLMNVLFTFLALEIEKSEYTLSSFEQHYSMIN